MTPESSPRRTPLFAEHERMGAKLVDFAGWQMPVQYSGVMAEHRAVRAAAGMFDVSHMGELRVKGEGAEDFLQRLTPNDVSKLVPGRIHYSALLTDKAGYIDDLLVYRLAQDEFLLVVNAANADKDFRWLEEHKTAGVDLENVSQNYALIAVQGPRAAEILAGLTEVDLGPIRYYRFVQGEVDGHEAILSRTGYTGEDGFELYIAPASAPAVWRRLEEVGAPLGLLPAGLGARDTLRLEAAMALYGHEIDADTTPLEAGLGWTVKLGKGEFVGREALLRQKEHGLGKKLVGFRVEGRGIARQGHEVWLADKRVGSVTSGSFSPTLERAIGMAHVAPELSEPRTQIEIQIRKKRVAAEVVPLPFYRRPT